MSSDNVSSAVTYTSISSDSNGLSWGIPLPAYVLDPMELDEYVPVYVPEPEHPEYHVPLDDDIQVEDQPYADDASPTAESPGYIADSDSMKEDTDEDSIDYPDEPEDGKEDEDEEDDDEDPEEDPSKEHEPKDDNEDPEEDLSEEHEPEDYDTKEEEPSEGSDETKPFKEDETVALIDAFAAGSPPFPQPPTSPAYDQAPLGHRAAMICIRDDIPEEDMPPWRIFVLTAPPPGCDVAESSAAAARAPRGQYDFVDTVEAGHGLIRSPGHDGQTIARADDRADDIVYVRALQASKHIKMTSIEEVNLRAYFSSEARNRALLARLETLKTHMSRMEWQRQSAEDHEVRQMMHTQVLEAKARIDTVEDAGSSC
ncbi:hypothetical protein Tco_0725962 [Tanacetum coccineum]|uniref:Uncharacterized protein n=1 Tax=Tanacetum coccineum TaxID=301880 RepID=A0ABQ4YGH0_9ASTR